jgi:hypothetical protein
LGGGACGSLGALATKCAGLIIAIMGRRAGSWWYILCGLSGLWPVAAGCAGILCWANCPEKKRRYFLLKRHIHMCGVFHRRYKADCDKRVVFGDLLLHLGCDLWFSFCTNVCRNLMYMLFLTSHSCRVTIFTFGFHLFLFC